MMPREVGNRIFKKKVVLLGNSAVGKTSMIRRFVKDRYDEKYKSTIGARVSKKSVKFTAGDESVLMVEMIWDLIGSQGYRATQATYIAGADCILLVHDLLRKESLESLTDYWLTQVAEVTKGLPPPMMIAGNKADLVAKEDRPNSKKILNQIKGAMEGGKDEVYIPEIEWYPTSAKTGENVDKCFTMMGIMMYHAHWESGTSLGSIMSDLGGLSAEEIRSECTTLLSLLDLIMVDLSDIGPGDTGNELLEKTFKRYEVDKDDPNAIELRKIIERVSREAVKNGFDSGKISQARKKWLDILDTIMRSG